MTVRSNFRWVAVGSLLIRNRANSPANAPDFNINDLVGALKKRAEDNKQYRLFNSETRTMWCDDIDESPDFFEIILQTGDKNVSGISFFNFSNRASRDIEKEDDEGGHYTAHVLIRKEPEPDGRYPILVEKVPGIYLSSVKDHFAWTCNSSKYEKHAPDPDDHPRGYRAIFEIDGFQSRTLRDALSSGVLKDIEFISYQEQHLDGHDEDPLIDEVVREARWNVGKRVTEDQARTLFQKAKQFMDDFTDEIDEKQMFVRIKSENGQIKRTEVDQDATETLEQAFIQNETITGFSERLPPRYTEFHQEVLQKMRAIGISLSD